MKSQNQSVQLTAVLKPHAALCTSSLRRWLWSAFGYVFIASALVVSQPAASGMLSGSQLVQQLRAGGCVLVMRHTQAPGTAPSAREVEPDNPHHERQLDEVGKSSARALGKALHALRIPIDLIYSSPTFRALQTIRLAQLGTPRTVAQLAESERGMGSTAEISQTTWLRHAVEQSPPAGSNTLIVTHTPNIVGAFGHRFADIQAGEMIVFKLDGSGSTRVIGRLSIAKWQQLAHQH